MVQVIRGQQRKDVLKQLQDELCRSACIYGKRKVDKPCNNEGTCELCITASKRLLRVVERKIQLIELQVKERKNGKGLQ